MIAGDGCLMEGVNHEAAGLAGHLKLGRLIVLWDDNRITIDGSTDLSRNEDVMARHAAMGWHTVECDGMDSAKVSKALDEACADMRPSLVRCKTIIGYGAPTKQGTSATHGAALGPDEVALARKELGWSDEAFVIPDDVPRAGAKRARATPRRARVASPARSSGKRTTFSRGSTASSARGLKPISMPCSPPPNVATRKASEWRSK